MWTLIILFAMWHHSGSIALDAEKDTSTEVAELKRFETCLLSSGTSAENIVFRGSGQEYEKLNWQWNAVNGYVMPMAYVVAKNVSDVQNSVICSKSSNVRIVCRSGGHSYVKYSLGDSKSVVIDLSHFNQVLPDPKQMTCEIGPGARAGRVTSTLWQQGEFLTTTAVNPSVGSGGVTLGGGYGTFVRQYGVACDNLMELEMVDANGKLLIINDHENTDLFWALRGGGGGSFGIVTKMKLKMYHAPKSIALGSIQFDSDDFPQFYDAWQSLMISDQLINISGYALMYNNIIHLNIYYLSTTPTSDKTSVVKIENLLKAFPFPKAKSSLVKVVSYPEFLLLDAQPQFKGEIEHISQLANIDEFLGWKKVKSFYVDKMLSKEEIHELHALSKPFNKLCTWHFEMNGGAINKFNSTDTAFIHRGKNMFHVQLKFIDENDIHPNLEGVSAMDTFYDKTKVLLNHRESYQNYMDGDITDYLQRYYGANLERLIQIKMKVDPKNVFHHPRSIPTKFNSYL